MVKSGKIHVDFVNLLKLNPDGKIMLKPMGKIWLHTMSKIWLKYLQILQTKLFLFGSSK